MQGSSTSITAPEAAMESSDRRPAAQQFDYIRPPSRGALLLTEVSEGQHAKLHSIAGRYKGGL
jgi:hypothetical protein